MKPNTIVKTGTLLFILFLFFNACSLTGYGGGEAEVSINLSDLSSRAPDTAVLTWISLTVSAADMTPIVYTEAELANILALNNGNLTIPVPAGASRAFTLAADTGTVIYAGAATANIPPDTTTEVVIDMILADVDYIIPDTNNGTIVQIDNMAGDNPVTTPILETIDTSYGPPLDVDFDSNGTIYSLARNTSWIVQAPAVRAVRSDWSIFQTAAQAYYSSLAVRRSDNTVFVVDEYEVPAIRVFSSTGVQGDDFDLSTLFFPMGAGGVNVSMFDVWDIAVLDTGEIGVAGEYNGESTGYAVLLLEYDDTAAPGSQWTLTDFVASLNNGTFDTAVTPMTNWPPPRLSAFASSFYLCGTATVPGVPGRSIQVHALPINPLNSALTYNFDRYLEYSDNNYELFKILPSIDGSIRMGVTDSDNNNSGLLLEYESFESDNPPQIYIPETPFDFYEG